MSKSNKIILAVVAGVLVICVCLSVVCIGAAGFLLIQRSDSQPFSDVEIPELIPTEDFAQPTVLPFDEATETPAEPLATPTAFSSEELDQTAAETLRTLEEEIVPINDVVDLAERLKGITGIPETVEPPAKPFEVGDQQNFWITNGDTNENLQVSATLRYGTDVVLFWIEDGVTYDQGDLRRLADTFSEEIYPTDRQFFGSEHNPGIDNDPRLYVLYTTGAGDSIAGYFSSLDSVHPLASEFSNAHEMFVINADSVSLGEEYIYSTMAHEFQHMIHHALDRNEETWMNEGFSELATLLNSYDPGGFDYVFISDPDLQLTTWESISTGDATPHYGSAFLFTTYFLGRFGDQATQALVADPANGMDSVDGTLQELGLKGEDGEQLSADDVFRDWTVANYVWPDQTDDPRFLYSLYEDAPKASPTESFETCPVDEQTRDVTQYGADYIQLTCAGNYTLNFEGATEVPLLPEKAASGQYAFWSNQGDESDMTLTREFDFSALSGDISLSYRTWFDIEEDYDYVYVEASTDGKSWDILETPSGTDYDPVGSNYAWGYTGPSDGWIDETVDLSAYAGKKVQLRFEYVTDAAVNGRGLLLDDIAVEALDYSSDLENDEGGWQADGFVRVAATLPQTFAVTLIKIGAETSVEKVALDELQRGSAEIEIGGDVSEVIVVVSGTTRFTTERAAYRFQIH